MNQTICSTVGEEVYVPSSSLNPWSFPLNIVDKWFSPSQVSPFVFFFLPDCTCYTWNTTLPADAVQDRSHPKSDCLSIGYITVAWWWRNVHTFATNWAKKFTAKCTLDPQHYQAWTKNAWQWRWRWWRGQQQWLDHISPLFQWHIFSRSPIICRSMELAAIDKHMPIRDTCAPMHA